MNAYELADELENKPLAYGDCIQDWLLDAAKMLRQQADRIAELEAGLQNTTGFHCYMAGKIDSENRIAELEKENSELKYEKSSGVYDAEPVAWIDKRTNKCVVFINTPPSDDWIPLYTTPQTKPRLSDEEIIKLFWDASWGTDEDVIKFARAIEERHGIK